MPTIFALFIAAAMVGWIISLLWHGQSPTPLTFGAKWRRASGGVLVALVAAAFFFHSSMTRSESSAYQYAPGAESHQQSFASFLFSVDKPDPTPTPIRHEFVSIVGGIYPNTEVYDQHRRYIGTIVAVDVKSSPRLVWLKYPDGHIEPKDWDALLTWGYRKNR